MELVLLQDALIKVYVGELNKPERAIESDASTDVIHLDRQLPASRQHDIISCCISEAMTFPEIHYLHNEGEVIFKLAVQGQLISIPMIKT